MKKMIVGLAALMYLVVPQTMFAQDGDDDDSQTVIVTTATTHIPFGPDRAKFMEYVEMVTAPQARNNPNILAYHVLEHYYGSHATEVAIVAVYPNLAAIEAPCGEPCSTWADANLPDEGEEGYDEFVELRDHYFKLFAKHSDEIYSSNSNRSKMMSQ